MKPKRIFFDFSPCTKNAGWQEFSDFPRLLGKRSLMPACDVKVTALIVPQVPDRLISHPAKKTESFPNFLCQAKFGMIFSSEKAGESVLARWKRCRLESRRVQK
jgi:hypothetical protein